MHIDSSRFYRKSNIELLRIIAMFLILVVHADFFALGTPSSEEMRALPIESLTRYVIESVAICAVNVFILISGWLGIRPKTKSLFHFLFQCVFFLFGICLAKWLFTGKISIVDIKGCFLLLKWNWFIKAYLLLFILSPVLNAFVENADRRVFKYVLISFFLFQTIYGWCSEGVVWFVEGYSTISFVGLYLLMRYLRIYSNPIGNKSWSFHMIVFIVCVVLISGLAIIHNQNMFFQRLLPGNMYSYINPLVIIESLSLFFVFLHFDFKSIVVNYIAASSFAVFLLHTNPLLCKPYFVPLINNLYSQYNGIKCLTIIFFVLIGIFFIAVLIDQLRIMAGNVVYSFIEK